MCVCVCSPDFPETHEVCQLSALTGTHAHTYIRTDTHTHTHRHAPTLKRVETRALIRTRTQAHTRTHRNAYARTHSHEHALISRDTHGRILCMFHMYCYNIYLHLWSSNARLPEFTMKPEYNFMGFGITKHHRKKTTKSVHIT